MHLKKSKEEILSEARLVAQSYVQNGIANSLHFNGYDSVDNVKRSVITAISHAVGDAVAEGLRVALDNIYMDEEFEKDIGL